MTLETRPPFSHIQYDWFQSSALVPNPHVVNERLDEDGRRVNQDAFWLNTINSSTNAEDEIRMHIFGDGSIEKKRTLGDDTPLPYNFLYNKDRKSLDIYEKPLEGEQGPSETKGALRQRFIHESNVFDSIHSQGSNARRKPILDLDISALGELGVSASEDGSVRVWNTKNGVPMRDLSRNSSGDSNAPISGHVGDVYVSKFLPSGEVIMTAGADRRILIWRIADSLCAAALSGHTAGVTSLSFIERGRNFVSSSRDGTIRLWDCASQSCITQLFDASSTSNSTNTQAIVNQCVVQKRPSIGFGDVEAASEKDFGTEGYVGVGAVNDGRCVLFDVRHRKLIQTLQHDAPLTTCAFLGDILTTGGTSGEIVQYDIRNTSKPLCRFSRGKSPILKVVSGWKGSPLEGWFACQDGTIHHFDNSPHISSEESPTIFTNLSGFDYDPVYALAFHSNVVYCGGRDGSIRKYDLEK